MKTHRLSFKNRSGTKLSALLDVPLSETPHFYVLFAHCFTCTKNLTAIKNISRALTQKGMAVMRFDFTGLGESEGDFTNTHFSANVDDLLSAAHFLEEQYKAPALLIGHSLGGAAVIFAAAQLPSVKAIATIGAPSSPQHVTKQFQEGLDEILQKGEALINIGGRPFTINKAFLTDLESQDLPSLLGAMRKALLILHSPQDNIVGIENAAALYQAAWHPKSFISLNSADHLLSRKEDSLYAGEMIATWASRYLEQLTNQEGVAVNDTLGHQVAVRIGRERYTTEIKTPRHHLLADEPEEVGGADLGPTPYDLLNAALGACTAMTMRMYADRKGWPLEEATVYLNHNKIHKQDSEAPASKISHLERIIVMKGDLSEEQRARLIEVANRCPVHRTLMEDIEITTREILL
jgi:uncharacterized OsmC-like protein/esterase/lipase